MQYQISMSELISLEMYFLRESYTKPDQSMKTLDVCVQNIKDNYVKTKNWFL